MPFINLTQKINYSGINLTRIYNSLVFFFFFFNGFWVLSCLERPSPTSLPCFLLVLYNLLNYTKIVNLSRIYVNIRNLKCKTPFRKGIMFYFKEKL